MRNIKTFNFTPISNQHQGIHMISFSERIERVKDSILKPHRTNFYILLFITEGISKHLIDFTVHDIKEEDFIIIRPRQVHAFFKSEQSNGTIIAFTEEFLLHKYRNDFLSEMAIFLHELSFDCLFNLRNDKWTKMDSLIQMIQQELAFPYDDLQQTLLQNHLSSLIANLIRAKREVQRFSLKKSKDILLALQFKSLVEKNSGKKTSVAQYAQEMGVSVRILQKITDLHFGKSPKGIIQDCLLLESKRMLIDPLMQVKEIAYSLGFNDPTNFTKFFKKYSQISPEQFRKMHI